MLINTIINDWIKEIILKKNEAVYQNFSNILCPYKKHASLLQDIIN